MSQAVPTSDPPGPEAGGGAPQPRPRVGTALRHAATVGVRVAVVVVALVVLGAEMADAVRTTDAAAGPAAVRNWSNNDRQMACLHRRVQQSVPEHAMVVFSGSGYDVQRLAEATGTWATPVRQAARARWSLEIFDDAAGCEGTQILARPEP